MGEIMAVIDAKNRRNEKSTPGESLSDDDKDELLQMLKNARGE